MPTYSRRSLLRLLGHGAGAATLASLGAPQWARAAATSSSDRRFLFIMCKGGWDFSYVFSQLFDNKHMTQVDDWEPAEANGIPFVASENRPSVSTFFETYGDRACVVNGIEVPSVAHDRCMRLTLTGSTAEDADDFPSIIAAASPNSLLMPYTILSGPGYTSSHGSAVVRIGENAQFADLLSDEPFLLCDSDIVIADSDVEAAVDDFVQKRAMDLAAATANTQRRGFSQTYGEMLERLALAGPDLDNIELGEGDFVSQLATAVSLFELGFARCAMVRNLGEYDAGWDTHADNYRQNNHYELLFSALCDTIASLDGKTSPTSGAPLADELTIVVASEMGRSPAENDSAGKDHWTFTSLLLIGAGVQGGQVIGAYGDEVTGERVDLESGELLEDGTKLESSHVGATLFALADLDYDEHFPSDAPIWAALK